MRSQAELTEILVLRIFDDEMCRLHGLKGQLLEYVDLGQHVRTFLRLVNEHVGFVQQFNKIANVIVKIHLLDDSL